MPPFAKTFALPLAVAGLAWGAAGSHAQDLPTDAQMDAATAGMYDYLGLVEYCQDKGFATAKDVAAMKAVIAQALQGMDVAPDAAAREAVGRGGEIVGPQIIGKIDLDNPAHPESVPAGRKMTMAANAAAQKTSEKALCTDMVGEITPPG